MMSKPYETVEELKLEVKKLKGILRSFAEHAVDCEGDDWICSLCGAHAALSVDIAQFPHETYCPMAPEST